MAPEQAITYTEVNGYFIPNLALPEQPEGNLDKYGRARLAFLREHKSVLHMHMMTQETLGSTCWKSSGRQTSAWNGLSSR